MNIVRLFRRSRYFALIFIFTCLFKEAISKDDAALIGTAKEDLQKTLNDAAAKLYQQAAPQGGAPDMNGAQPNGGNPTGNNGGDPNVYDADFTDVDDNK